MNILKIRKALDEHKISALELTEFYIKRIKKYNKKLNSYITVCEEEAIGAAKTAQEIIDRGGGGILTGIPVSIKDNICTKGIKTTCASKMLCDFVSVYDATVSGKLKNSFSVMLGKTNMDEFGMGSTSQNSYYGGVRNPYNLDYVSGGSSGGAASSVSAKLCVVSLGTDTGGSIRLPASFCGVTGLKPTYGTVSRYGLIAFASSFDQIGVCANSAIDCACVLDAIYGVDKNDLTTSNKAKGGYTSKTDKTVKGIKIGIPKEFFDDGIDDGVKSAILNAANYYKAMGCEIVECSIPSLEFALSAYYIISSAEASSNLSRFDGIRFGFRSEKDMNFNDLIKHSRSEGFGDEVKRRIMLGNYVLSSGYYDEYYNRAKKICKKLKEEYAQIFKMCDVILTPTAPTTAYKIGETENNPVKMYHGDIYTVSANITGLPAISTTCGYDGNGMPIGMTLVGRPFDECTIIGLCDCFEKDFEKKEAVAYEL